MDGPKVSNLKVLTNVSRRSNGQELGGPKNKKWTKRDESGRSKGIKFLNKRRSHFQNGVRVT